MIEEKEFYTCKNDRAFKEVFMRKENKDLLIKLLESTLDIKIKELKYLNVEKTVDNVNIRSKRFDLHVKTEKENIQIEVNSQMQDYVRPRNASFLFDTYSHGVKVGDEYDQTTLMNLKKTELEKLSKKDKVVERYMSEIERVNEDPDFREYISAEEDAKKIEKSLRSQYRREALAEGRAEGISIGEENKSIEVAKKLKEKGVDINIISDSTGLAKEEIEAL